MIEHISELAEYMQLIVRLTHLNSHAYITTPDLGSPNVPRPVMSWDVFAPPHHVQFFNGRNLAFLFNRYGFEQIRKFPDQKAGLKVLFKRIV